MNTLGDHIRARRLTLKLTQKQVAELIGVIGATITNWERNASTPVVRYMPAIIRFLGYDPLPPAESLPGRLRLARRELGLTQRKMAERMGVDPCTLRDWENGRHQPLKKSLDIIARATAAGAKLDQNFEESPRMLKNQRPGKALGPSISTRGLSQ